MYIRVNYVTTSTALTISTFWTIARCQKWVCLLLCNIYNIIPTEILSLVITPDTMHSIDVGDLLLPCDKIIKCVY